ncbi:unnamed protein product, partial [Didymodactylos carnosus]
TDTDEEPAIVEIDAAGNKVDIEKEEEQFVLERISIG